MPPPRRTPIGLHLGQVAKAANRAFEDAMAAAGSSGPVWQILIALKTRPPTNQRELAAAIGIQGATLTHHLNAMENDGIVVRRRDPANRRVHVVELTAEGEELFHRLRRVAVSFDKRLRGDLGEQEIDTLYDLLDRLRDNIGPG